MADRKDLPPPTAANFLGRVREEMMRMMGKQGERIDQVVTVRDLVAAGLAKLKPSGGFEASPDLGGSSAPEQDLTPPPTPSGFALASAISHVLIEHDAPTYTQGGGHGRTRVYGVTHTTGPLPTFAQAVELGQFSGTVWAMPSNPATTWRLWIKWETADGVVSAVPAGGTNGLAVTTGQDVSKMVQAMTGAGNPFTILTAPTTIGGFLYPAGTYSVQSFIIDSQITNAKIADLAVDNAKIASVSVDKLTAGSLAVGQHIQSTSYTAGSAGWRINADGTAELNNVTVRGTVVASAGNIGGNTINATGIQSPNYVAGTAGWRINSSGTAELNNVTVRGTVAASNITGSTITGTTMNSGTINIQSDGGSDWGYARSNAKWWTDGADGWVFGREPGGHTLAEIKAGALRFWMSSWGDCGIQFPGITMTGGGLTISQANVIDTFNVAGGAVSALLTSQADSVSIGTSNTGIVSVTINVPNGSSGVHLIFTALATNANDPNYTASSIIYGVHRNGTSIFEKLYTGVTVFNSADRGGVMAFAVTDTPSGGSNTYTVYARRGSTAVYRNSINNVLSCQLSKR